MSRVSMSSYKRKEGNTRQISPLGRLMRTDSSLFLNASVASLHSLRNGQVTSFNQKINDAFPNYDKKGKSIMPVLSLPTILSLEPKLAFSERNAVDWKDSSAQLYKENQHVNRGSKKTAPSRSLSTATEAERSYVKLFLHISDVLLNDIEMSENKTYNKNAPMITLFEKAGKKLRPSLVSATDLGDDASTSTNDYGESSFGDVKYPGACTSQITSSRGSSLPAVNTKVSFSGHPHPSAQLSPTWSLRSFSLQGNKPVMEKADFDWDSLSYDQSVCDSSSVSLKTTRTTKRASSKPLSRSQSSRRIKQSKPAENMNEMSADRLKAELLTSLINMQRHTVMVQEGIMHVQDLTPITSQRAKSVVTLMAAERMKLAMANILNREMRRGWDAWVMDVRMQNRAAAANSVNRFLQLRYLAFLLRQHLLKKLAAKFVPWKKKYLEHKEYLRMKLSNLAATSIQRVTRGVQARRRVAVLRERGKYQALYKSTIKIQAIFRCKLQRWQFLLRRRKLREDRCARFIQRVFRGHKGRKITYKKREVIWRYNAAVKLQNMVRSRTARKRAAQIRHTQTLNKSAVKIQAIMRGKLARKNVLKYAQEKRKVQLIVRIQKRVRGMIARLGIEHRKAKLKAERTFRITSAVNIQRVYRGHRGRTYFKIKAVDYLRKRRRNAVATTQITCVVRGFLGRCTLKRMKKERYAEWVKTAKRWKETWSAEANAWFYLDSETGEALWEPPSGGYTKNDGMFLLGSGETIMDPAKSGMSTETDYNTNRLCSECFDRVAIRKCDECGDKFCTICFKETHMTGTRKSHTWKPTGPIDCSDCEKELADRWCITCDEAFCDACWRTVHSKGKRKFHPFSEVDISGKIDKRMFTIDGAEVFGGYDSAYPQREADREASASAVPAAFAYEGDAAVQQTDSEWAEYYDSEGTVYWYNNYTQVSQYENPYY